MATKMRVLKFVRQAMKVVRRNADSQELSPPALTEPKRFPFGPFRFKIQASRRIPYTVFGSTDLANWDAIAVEQAKSQAYEYVDSEAPKFNSRFYRVVATNVPPSNVIGYASTTLPPGFSLIANPFHGYTVGTLFTAWPHGTSLNKFDTAISRLTENKVEHGRWTNPNQQLLPGEGAIFYNPTSDYKMHTFVGDVAQGTLTVPIPSGFSLRSSLFPKAGDLAERLNFPIENGDVVHLFDRDRQKYLIHTFEHGNWVSGPPILSMGEAFWIAKAEPANWTDTVMISSHNG